ncbi:MAG: tRNA (adenosine(37)-N6)-threonylcarbamoyltransferase complex transferase subunit TsaD [Chloroflexota bacterium]|nr:tRNA (adenosine(37)-N6)-threonylcarbamoyltransferase complex transferase subunit TsaD [Chloroflexota bacterium]
MKILGIETSCDETAVGVVEDGRRLLSNIVSSQVQLHAPYGGVVPEVASRQHIRDMAPALERALSDSQVDLDDIDVVAATCGPGLAGSLLTGLNTAKALSLSLGKPLVGVNHLEGHIYASWLARGAGEPPEEAPGFPLACLVASGGHTDLILMEGHGQYRLVGRTRDDAAGEAFDKAARILGLGFPGGPEIQKASDGVAGDEFPPLPRAWMRDTLDFSFSGVKTALLHLAQAQGLYPRDPESTGAKDKDVEEKVSRLVGELAANFQQSVVEVMVVKTLEMAKRYNARGIVLGGGVTANARLRADIATAASLPVIIPPPVLCTDNGAMIAACAYFQYSRGEEYGLDLDIDPALPLG